MPPADLTLRLLAARGTFMTLVVLAALPPVEAYFERRTGFVRGPER